MKRSSLRPWLIVAGGLDDRGGMDKANLALARYLVRDGREVHIVAHRVDQELSRHSRVTVHLARSPLGSSFLGERLLALTGRAVARSLIAASPDTVVLANGGNLAWPGINWVHSVHRAWNRVDRDAPLWFRAKNLIAKSTARRREARAFAASRTIIANSERTRADLAWFPTPTKLDVFTVYLGSDSGAHETTNAERAHARSGLSLPPSLPVVLFVGALSYDNNKGLDILVDAWRHFVSREGRRAKLLIAGGGNAVEAWRGRLARDPLLARTASILGYNSDIQELYAAADILVAPSRYEAYGLAAHEAICTGLPVITGTNAGIAELYPPDLHDLLLKDPSDIAMLASLLDRWHLQLPKLRSRFVSFGTALRSRTWDDMAREMVEIAESRSNRSV